MGVGQAGHAHRGEPCLTEGAVPALAWFFVQVPLPLSHFRSAAHSRLAAAGTRAGILP